MELRLSRRAIYNTFRSKPALFVQALRRAASKSPVLSELESAAAPRVALVRMLEMAAGSRQERQRRPLALLIEAVAVPKHRDPEVARLVDETLLDMEARIRQAVERGQTDAEIDAEVDAVAVARVLLVLYLCSYVLAVSGVAGQPVQRAAQQQAEELLPASRCSNTSAAAGGEG